MHLNNVNRTAVIKQYDDRGFYIGETTVRLIRGGETYEQRTITDRRTGKERVVKGRLLEVTVEDLDGFNMRTVPVTHLSF